MKRYLILIIISIFLLSNDSFSQDNVELVAQCAGSAGDVTYLKDFIVKLDPGIPGGNPPSAKFSMVLSKNTQYRLSICTAPDSEGEAILQLFDMNVLVGSTYISSSGKDYPSFDIKIQKTGVYHVFISFKEGKAGEAVGILSFVKKL